MKKYKSEEYYRQISRAHYARNKETYAERNYKRRLERHQRLRKEFGNACVICGYDRCQRALEFHHLDKTTKKFNISECKMLRWETLLEEAKKCILVCANCHRELECGLIEFQEVVAEW